MTQAGHAECLSFMASAVNQFEADGVSMLPFWMNMFHTYLGNPQNLLAQFNDLMLCPDHPYIVKRDYLILIMLAFEYDDSDFDSSVLTLNMLYAKNHRRRWKECVLRNREYEGFLDHPIINELKNHIFSYL